MPIHPAAPGRTLRYWVATTLKDARKQTDVLPRDISTLLDVDASRIYNFERGTHWPDDVDQIIAAYAELLGVKDPRTFYRRALKRWHDAGERPRVEPSPDPATRYAAKARRARRPRQVAHPSPATPSPGGEDEADAGP